MPRRQSRGGSEIPATLELLQCALEKAARIKQQLGGSGDYADPDPERPKSMHRRTYERLCNEAAAAQLPYQDRIMKRLHGFLAKSGLLPQTESERPDEEQVMKGVQRQA